ncbi:MAG TPA: class I SAM-dependent rRNA methyltransferase [Steroidobacteraceae bacterium]|jgi:23S rRNA (cytosine1962-C5)-methyltransferase|nr:class I SAM-dependent rRNA methyltransferase [Steroidobacteraceae bacterium]
MSDQPETGPRVLRLKRGEERRLASGHLWVFSNEIDTGDTPLTDFAPGEMAQLRTHRDAVIGYAYVNPHALICARILTRDAAPPDVRALIERRLKAALVLREGLSGRPFYRWVYGESDLLPGLVLDRYGDVVVGQIATAGMEALREDVSEAVRRTLAPRALYWKNDTAARDLEHLTHIGASGFGTVPEELEIEEAGLTFRVPLAAGQKTGWFYDQAANRQRLARYVRSGARVLDVCAYAGAWALIALSQGAASARCLDSSQAALAVARANAERNGRTLETLHDDAFDGLKALAAAGERFDVVILDPPAFIKRKKDIPAGQAAYRKLNQLALGVLSEGGLLVSCSCSYHLAPEELLDAIQSAARHTRRFVQVLEAGGQSPDHPVHPAIPETRYLKAFFCRASGEVG